MVNSTERKEYVWVDLAKQWEQERLEGMCALNPRTHMQLRNKFDCMLREARKHNLLLARQNGTHGSSGNGREAVESLLPPPFFEELLNRGFLEGPMANKPYVLSGQRGVASLGVGSTSADEGELEEDIDEAYMDAGWGG